MKLVLTLFGLILTISMPAQRPKRTKVQQELRKLVVRRAWRDH